MTLYLKTDPLKISNLELYLEPSPEGWKIHTYRLVFCCRTLPNTCEWGSILFSFGEGRGCDGFLVRILYDPKSLWLWEVHLLFVGFSESHKDQLLSHSKRIKKGWWQWKQKSPRQDLGTTYRFPISFQEGSAWEDCPVVGLSTHVSGIWSLR